MEQHAVRGSKKLSISILGCLVLSIHVLGAIELREVQRTVYIGRALPFYAYFTGDTCLSIGDGDFTITVHPLSDIEKVLYKSSSDARLLRTLQGKAILDFGKYSRHLENCYLYNERENKLDRLIDSIDSIRDDYYIVFDSTIGFFNSYPDRITPISVDGVLQKEGVGNINDSIFCIDALNSHSTYEQQNYNDISFQIDSIYPERLNSNHGINYLLEMYFRLGSSDKPMYGIASLSDDKIWSLDTYTMKTPSRIWRVDTNHIWGIYEFRIPYWRFLNPRFVAGSLEACKKNGYGGQEYEMFSLGILDTKGNVITTNIKWLLDMDVSLNGRYMVVTGVEDNGKETKWNGPYPTILYEITYSGNITDNNVRLRDAPGTNGKIVSVLKKGQPCIVLEHSKTRQTIDGVKECWYKIRLPNDVEGWVFGAWLDYW